MRVSKRSALMLALVSLSNPGLAAVPSTEVSFQLKAYENTRGGLNPYTARFRSQKHEFSVQSETNSKTSAYYDFRYFMGSYDNLFAPHASFGAGYRQGAVATTGVGLNIQVKKFAFRIDNYVYVRTDGLVTYQLVNLGFSLSL